MSNISLPLKKTPLNSRIPSNKAMNEQKNIIQIIDKSLKHLNQISQANIVAQELYIQLLKEKKTMKFDQIKKIYFTLTESKAKEILFQRDKQELIKTDYQNHQGLVRLCWRSIEKLIKKITYYMVNENNLSPISKSTLNLIHFHQHFVRRFQKVKNSSMLFVIQMMEKLIQQNSILEKKIYDILLNRGYVVSLDEFYKLNGYDAEHRDAYEAKLNTEIQQKISQPQRKAPQILTQQSFMQNFKKPFGRKKKVFKFDNRYSWRQNLIIQDQQNKKSFPLDKTNFQIRQSFDKFIGDFLENQHFKEILINYQNQQNPQKKGKNSQTKKKIQFVDKEGLIQKKIFQSKIEPVIAQLKSSNITIKSKILEIINDSSTEAINSKLNQNERRTSERKNSYKRQGSKTAQKKIRESYSINDRKLVNQNLYRELLKRNKQILNYLSQEIDKDTGKVKSQLQIIDGKQISDDFNLIQHPIKQHNQNSVSNFKKTSRCSNSLKNKTFTLKSPLNLQKRNSSTMTLKNKFNFLQNQFHQINFKKQQNEIQQLEGNKYLAEKIRIAKEDWQLKNQKSIFEALQKAQIDPLNPFKITQILEILSKQNASKMHPFQNQFFQFRPATTNEFQRTKFNRIKTEGGQRKRNDPKIRDMTNDFNPFSQRNLEKYSLKKVRTQNSPSKINERNPFQVSKNDNKIYEVFDRKMRRIIRH